VVGFVRSLVSQIINLPRVVNVLVAINLYPMPSSVFSANLHRKSYNSNLGCGSGFFFGSWDKVGYWI
jgi:hypothetical protein